MLEPELLAANSLLTAATPSGEGLEDTGECQKYVEALLAEVNALSTQWRQTVGLASTGDQLLAGEAIVLQTIQKLGPRTVPQIALARLTSRQNIQVLVNRLIAGGCLEANRNPRHKRSVVISLTTRGSDLLAKSANRQEEIIKGFSTRVSAKKVSEAVEILNQLRLMLAQGVGGRRRKPDHSQPRSSASDLENTSPALGSVQPEMDELPVNLL